MAAELTAHPHDHKPAASWPGSLRASYRSGRLAGPARSLALLIAVCAIFSVVSPSFGTPYNVTSVLAFAVPAVLVAIGQTFVITLGEIDLSVASVAALAGIVFILLEPQGVLVALLAAAGVGLAAGLFNGLSVVVLGVPSLVSTLAMLFIAQGLAYMLASQPINGSNLDLTIAMDQSLGWILTPRILIGLIISLLAALALGRTVWGRRLYARGSQPGAAAQLGLPDASLVLSCLGLSGLLAALSGTITAIGLNSASPVLGGDLLLLSIAACLIGGSRLEGGTGSVVGTALALVALVALQNGMDQLGVNAYVQQVIRGTVVLVALLATGPGPLRSLTSRRRSPSSDSSSRATASPTTTPT